MIAGAVLPWEVVMATGDAAFASEHYTTAKAVVDFQTRHVDPQIGLVTWGFVALADSLAFNGRVNAIFHTLRRPSPFWPGITAIGWPWTAQPSRR